MHTEAISGTVARCSRTQSRWSGSRSSRPGAGAARMDEHVQRGSVVQRVMGAQDEVLGADDVRAAGRQAGDVPAVLGVLLGPVARAPPRARPRRAPRPRRTGAARCDAGRAGGDRVEGAVSGGCRHRGASWSSTWCPGSQPRGDRPASPRSKRRVRPGPRGPGACTVDACWSAVSRSWQLLAALVEHGATRVGRQRGGARGAGRRQVGAARRARERRPSRRPCCAPRGSRSRHRWRSRHCIGCCAR